MPRRLLPGALVLSALVALLLSALSLAAANLAPVNLDFEAGTPGEVPPGWLAPANTMGYTGVLGQRARK